MSVLVNDITENSTVSPVSPVDTSVQSSQTDSVTSKLDDIEIAIISEIKELEARAQALFQKLRDHQRSFEVNRIETAVQHFETGFMNLIRAVIKPFKN